MPDESTDYRQMWSDLGLDLNSHDALLGAVGQMYGDAYLTQENRPEGMGYLDFVMSEVHGLRIKELRRLPQAAGGKVVGTFCLYVPEEIIRAAGAWCVGLCAGAEFAYDEVERIMPRNTCALIKSFMGFKLAKVCPYIEEADLVDRRDHVRRQEEGVRAARRDAQRVRHGAAADEAAAGHRVLARRDRRARRARSRSSPATTLTAEIARGRHQGGQRQAPRAAAHRGRRAPPSPAPICGKDALLATQVAFYDDVPRFTQMMNALADELEERVADGVGVAPADAPSACSSPARRWRCPTGSSTTSSRRPAASWWARRCAPARATTTTLVPEDGDDGRRDARRHRRRSTWTSTAPASRPTTGASTTSSAWPRSYNADGVIDYALQFCAHVPDRGVHGGEGRSRRPASRSCKIDTDYSDGGHRPALDARRGVPRDALGPRRHLGRACEYSDSTSARAASTRCGSDGGRVVDARRRRLRLRPAAVGARTSSSRGAHDALVATGYGRHAARDALRLRGRDRDQGVRAGRRRACSPRRSAVLDIGGQDTKVIALGAGRAGRRLRDERQVRRRHRQVPRGDGARARLLRSRRWAPPRWPPRAGVKITSMCTVFAESEVTGLVHRGEDRGRIARGLHESIAEAHAGLAEARRCAGPARVRRRRGQATPRWSRS